MPVGSMFGLGVLLSLQNQLSPVAKAAQRDVETLRESIVDLDQRLQRFEGFERLGAAGRTMSLMVTGPIVGALYGAARATIGFESAFVGVRKTIDETEEGFAQLEAGITEMSRRLPESREQLASVMSIAGQLGVRGIPNLLRFTEVATGMGVATNLSAEAASTAMARFAAIMEMPLEQVDRLGSTIVALGNRLPVTEAEITEMGLRIAGAGKQIGLTEPQVMGLAAALASVGIEAEAGGSAISRVLINMANAVRSNTEELGLFAYTAGMSTDQFRRAFEQDAAGALVAVVEGLRRLADSGENVFAVLEQLGIDEIRTRDAMLRLAGSGERLRQALDIANAGWQQNVALTEEVRRRNATAAAQLGVLRNRLAILADAFGRLLVPALIRGIEIISPFIDALANAPAPVRALVLVLAGLAAAAGPALMLMAMLGQAVTGWPVMLAAAAKSWQFLTTVLSGATTAFQALTVAMAANPIGLILVGIGLLIAGLLAFRANLFGVRDAVAGVWAWLRERFDELVGWFAALPDRVAELVGALKDRALQSLGSWWESIKQGFADAFNPFKRGSPAPIDVATQGVDALGGVLARLMGPIEAVRAAVGTIPERLATAAQAIAPAPVLAPAGAPAVAAPAMAAPAPAPTAAPSRTVIIERMVVELHVPQIDRDAARQLYRLLMEVAEEEEARA